VRCAISQQERSALIDAGRWTAALLTPAVLGVFAMAAHAPMPLAIAVAGACGVAILGALRRWPGLASEAAFTIHADDLPDLVFRANTAGIITHVNNAARRVLEYEPRDLIGRPLAEVASQPVPEFGDETDVEHHVWTATWRRGDGRLAELTSTLTPLRRQGAHAGIRGVAHDNSDRLATERALGESEERFRAALDTARNGIMVVSHDRRVLLANQALRRLLGYKAEEITNLTLADILSPAHIDQVVGLMASRMWSDAGRGHYEVQLIDAGGRALDVEIALSPMREAGRSAGVLIDVHDLTEARRASETIRRMADYDRLTGLPNRDLFDRHVQRALVDATSLGRSVAVLMIDLDRFKLVNDTLGHASGDRLLKAVADRLAAQTPQQHVVARFGGDEFLVLAPDLGGPTAAEAVARRVLAAFQQPFEHDGLLIKLSASIGVAIGATSDIDADAMIRIADAALHEAKANGRDRYAIGSDAASNPARVRLALEADLRRAVQGNELEVYYQPQCDPHTGEVRGLEALLRWHHPTRGLIPPTDFVPLLEETGLIVPVGEWVLRTACTQLAEWHATGLTQARVAVNLSPRQLLVPNLSALVRNVLSESGLAPAALELELTETAVVLNLDAIIDVLEELNASGVTIAIDDFGVGQSWLVRLRDFPVRTLKVDRYFVAGVDGSPGGIAIVQAIVALGHALGLLVIAEGVETLEELQAIRAVECDLVQGFYYSPALSKRDVEALLRASRPADVASS
jgi:diguanylate cyclase (GGDEF)-like protein/PAS domain S-box-containing protein